MSLADQITNGQNDEDKKRETQRKKCGAYSGGRCPNCMRQRIMIGSDKKHRCEKCAWCLEDDGYDFDLLDYLSWF